MSSIVVGAFTPTYVRQRSESRVKGSECGSRERVAGERECGVRVGNFFLIDFFLSKVEKLLLIRAYCLQNDGFSNQWVFESNVVP